MTELARLIRDAQPAVPDCILAIAAHYDAHSAAAVALDAEWWELTEADHHDAAQRVEERIGQHNDEAHALSAALLAYMQARRGTDDAEPF